MHGLPIYNGATGPTAQELAGEIADGFTPFFISPGYIPGEEMIDGWSLSGSPERGRESLAALIEAGITPPVFAVFSTPLGREFAAHMQWLQHNLWREFL